MGKKLISVSATLCRSRCPLGLRLHAGWNWGFESLLGHGSLSLVRVVYYQVEISASGWSLAQRSPTECGVSNVCDRQASIMKRPWLTRGCGTLGKNQRHFPWAQCDDRFAFRDLISAVYYLISIFLSRMFIRAFSLRSFLTFGSAV
jgi:hypothetical protein